jgi:hypothetical protein
VGRRRRLDEGADDGLYARLVAGETDRLRAFTAAREALRRQRPEPFHWTPFLYLGSPD